MKFLAEPVDVGGADFHRHAAPIDIVLSGHVELPRRCTSPAHCSALATRLPLNDPWGLCVSPAWEAPPSPNLKLQRNARVSELLLPYVTDGSPRQIRVLLLSFSTGLQRRHSCFQPSCRVKIRWCCCCVILTVAMAADTTNDTVAQGSLNVGSAPIYA